VDHRAVRPPPPAAVTGSRHHGGLTDPGGGGTFSPAIPRGSATRTDLDSGKVMMSTSSEHGWRLRRLVHTEP
jgi:hypothetical protein